VLVNHEQVLTTALPLPPASKCPELLKCLDEVYSPFLELKPRNSPAELFSRIFDPKAIPALTHLVCPIKMVKGNVLNFVFGAQNSNRGMLVVLGLPHCI
jgi:hypothetical protein